MEKVYINGFIIQYSAADVTICFTKDLDEAVNVTMSYSAVKSLKNRLEEFVNVISKITDTEIKTLEEIHGSIQNAIEANNVSKD